MRDLKNKRPLILTCSLCANFDPNRKICKITKQPTEAISTEYARDCEKKGIFIRYMPIIPDAFNYYSLAEEIPVDYRMDLSSLPKDKEGIPLFVNTKRGIERAIPADPNVELRSNWAFGVESIYTYQGQRELIYDLGIELAQKEAEKAGVQLTVLPEERKAESEQKQSNDNNGWMKNDPEEEW